jgi:hypothetical protein
MMTNPISPFRHLLAHLGGVTSVILVVLLSGAFVRAGGGVERTVAQSWPSVSRLLSVVGLFPSGRPSAITRLVVPVVVDPVEHQVGRRSASHVGDKRLEALAPALAHSDSASPVALVIERRWPITAIPHGAPDSIFGPSSSDSCSSMAKVDFPASFKVPTKTSAAAQMPGPQILRPRNLVSSAFAFAEPSRSTPRLALRLCKQHHHPEATECLSS